MTEAVKIKRKPGRKSNAEKAAILAAQEQARAGEQNSLGAEHAEPDEGVAVDDHVERRRRPNEVRASGALESQGLGDAEVQLFGPDIEGPGHEVRSQDIGRHEAGGGVGESVSGQDVHGALGAHERQGLINEALYVHEMQESTARYDSFNRRWAFRPDSINYVASLTIECKRGPDKREVSISNARFGAENVVEDVMAAIDLLDEAMT